MRAFLPVLLALVGAACLGAEPQVRALEPGRAIFTASAEATAGARLRVEAGTVLAGEKPADRFIVLRSGELTAAPGTVAELSLPAAALSIDAAPAPRGVRLTAEKIGALEPVLKYCATANDLPAATAQLVVLCFAEDIALPQWRSFLARQRPGEDPAHVLNAQDIAVGVDALAILRTIAPERRFALQADAELKLRALREPATRLRAMQLYGLALPEVAPLPPDLGSLLHTKPGDNCPICRQRALMQPREDGL